MFGWPFFILAVLAIVGALIGGSGDGPSTSSFTGMSTEKALVAQARKVRQQVLTCTLTRTFGSSSFALVGGHPRDWPRVGGQTATPGNGAMNVSNVMCPADAAGRTIWDPAVGVPLDTPPTGFGPWQYVRDDNGICIRIALATPGAEYSQAIASAAVVYGRGEALVHGTPANMLTVWLHRGASPGASRCTTGL